jgi:hypothetical protein
MTHGGAVGGSGLLRGGKLSPAQGIHTLTRCRNTVRSWHTTYCTRFSEPAAYSQ